MPDSLRAKMLFTALLPSGAREDVSVVIFSVPQKRYRMEMSGLMGVAVASLLWQEGEWTLVLPREEAYLQGTGDLLPLPGTGLPPMDIPLLGGILGGRLLPPGHAQGESWVHDTLRVLRWPRAQGGFWRAELGLRSGAPLRLVHEGGSDEIHYSNYSRFGEQVLPAQVEVMRDGRPVLQMQMRELRTDASWGNGIWRLRVPSEFRKLQAG